MRIGLKGTYFFTVLFLCFPTLVHAQDDSRKKYLILSTSIISREYVNNNMVEMNLRLRFRNTGMHPLILYKPLTHITETSVFEYVEPHSPDTFAQVLAMVSDPPREIPYKEVVKRQPNKDFIVIAPSRTYQMEERVGINVRAKNRKQSVGAKDDRYFLIVKVLTWNISQQDKELAAKLRRRWKRFGILWSEAIESEPMSFTIEREKAN